MKKFCIFAALIACALLTFTTSNFAQRPPEQDYLVYVLSESADKISLLRFGPNGARVEREFSEPGTVEVLDLIALKTVATVDVAQQAAGIDFWQSEPVRKQ